MKKLYSFCWLIFSLHWAFAQPAKTVKPTAGLQRPKLVVGFVVDQMRWDYQYRYNERFAPNGGFNRFLNQGFSCENTLIPYTPTITACGHSCIYTGSVPAIHGITGNNWFDNVLQRDVYCVEDDSVKTVGSNSKAGEMSPKNVLSNTITDELRLATNFRSKVIGVAIKDRGSIIPAGHSANGAYWYDSGTGQWITSTYYMNELPEWVKQFNARAMPDKYFAGGWNTLYPINTYVQSTKDEEPYESKPLGAGAKSFPYDLKPFIGKSFGTIASTPFGNTMTLDMARAALDAEKLGNNSVPDFLAVSLSSPDYVGHAFGPNSVEEEDVYLRLDKDLGSFFEYLDQKVGKGQYLVFLSADHGVAHVPAFMKENKLPAGTFSTRAFVNELNEQLKTKYGIPQAINGLFNYQLFFNEKSIDSMKLNRSEIGEWIVSYAQTKKEISRAFMLDRLMETTLNSKIKDMVTNGYYPRRSGDIQIVLQPGYIDGGATGTTHGGWAPYDAHIPLLWYGWNIKHGKTNRETYMTDIASTVAALLHIQMPNGAVGHVIEEVMKN